MTSLCFFYSYSHLLKVVSILLERSGYGALAEKIIFMAGHKVTNDPVAIPFSKVLTADINE